MREDVYAHALHASQIVIRAEVWTAPLRWEGDRKLVLNPCVVVFGPISPARMLHEVSRTEELAERRRAHSVDRAGLEVEEHRARHVLAARDLVVQHVDAVELRGVVAQYSPSPQMPCSSYYLQKLGAYLVTALARLHVQKLTLRSSLNAGSTREKKGGEERGNARLSRTGK